MKGIIIIDLENRNQFIVAAALNAIGEIATPDMCRDTCPEVLKCLTSSNPYIKKKVYEFKNDRVFTKEPDFPYITEKNENKLRK